MERVAPMKFQWFLIMSGDSRNMTPGASDHDRHASFEYPAQVAGAAGHVGFDAVLTPVWPDG
jgi:hypothetical protein